MSFSIPWSILLCQSDKSLALQGADEILRSGTKALPWWRIRVISEDSNDIFKAPQEWMSLVQHLTQHSSAPTTIDWQGYPCFAHVIRFMTIHVPWCNCCPCLFGLSIDELCTLMGKQRLLTRHDSEEISYCDTVVQHIASALFTSITVHAVAAGGIVDNKHSSPYSNEDI